jgi:hypothetical protein
LLGELVLLGGWRSILPERIFPLKLSTSSWWAEEEEVVEGFWFMIRSTRSTWSAKEKKNYKICWSKRKRVVSVSVAGPGSGSGSALILLFLDPDPGMRIRIQEHGSWPKLTNNKPGFVPLKLCTYVF